VARLDERGPDVKRAGNLFETICSWENLELAARRARRRKRYRGYVERFELRRESVLSTIRGQLLDGIWRPQPMREFRIHDPKERLISAPAYRDRIVHHALCNVIGPVLERSMIAHSYSCRVGLGTGAARAQCKRMVSLHSHVLKMDVRRYFPSIDHALLKEKLRRLIKCRPTLELTDRIIEGWRSTDDGPAWFAGDDLLTAAERPRGLPIGALTSQLFANLFLNRIDHAIEEECRPAGYARYTDDLLVFGNDKRRLGAIRERLFVEFAAERLKPHPTKCRVHACREGVPFLGFRYWPDRVRVLRANRIRFEKRMSRLRRATRKDRSRLREVWPAMFGWFQFAREYGVNEGLVRAQCRHQVFG
jgi:RNA-directed DNA polymerase